MSSVVRQSNLFAGEDFTQIYKSFKDINFTAYDFDSIRDALINYVRVYYPEDFNDYIESSEFIALIELLAYLGTSLSFRSDLNARENIIDTAERRDSIIRLAKLINYQTRRNTAATGLLKVTSVKTDQPIVDANGNSLSNVSVLWNDPNNLSWYDQFVSVLNACFNPRNPFGSPSKNAVVGGIVTDMYALNNITGLNVAYNLNVNVNGESLPIDIVNPDIVDEQIAERHPNQDNSFNLIYRNDSLGLESANTGFFLKFIQGRIQKFDEQFDFPVPNRVWDIPSNNVNNTDVYVQEINSDGVVLTEWKKVPSVSGSNVIYNSLNFAEENIYEVLSELDDKISVKFPDGNFGTVPTGVFRIWFRQSAGKKVQFRPETMSDLRISLPYISSDNQEYRLTISFGLQNTISNGIATETNDQIKTRAPQVYYTQDRMVNNADYNILPIVIGNSVLKVRSINRTYSGHSRFTLNDPTGFTKGLTILGDDGAIYSFDDDQRFVFPLTNNTTGNIYRIAITELSKFLNIQPTHSFFNNVVLPQFRESRLPLNDFNLTFANTNLGWWKTSPNKPASSTGFFIYSNDVSESNWPYGTANTNVISNSELSGAPSGYKFIKAGSAIVFTDPTNPQNEMSTSVKSIASEGIPFDPLITLVGPIEMGSPVRDAWRPKSVIPMLRTIFTTNEIDMMEVEMAALQSFGIKYNILDDAWEIIPFASINENATYQYGVSSADWYCVAKYIPATSTTPATYEFISRGNSVIFESATNVRFFWDINKTIDANDNTVKNDTIDILRKVNDGSDNLPLKRTISWNLYDRFMQNDGYVDTAKVKVAPADYNYDSYSDVPDSFLKIVGKDDEVLVETYIDSNGYTSTRLWNGTVSTSTYVDSIGNPVTSVTADYNAIAFVTTLPILLSDANMFIFDDYSVLDALRASIEIDINDPLITSDVATFLANMDTKFLKIKPIGSDIDYANSYYRFVVLTTDVGSTISIISDVRIKGYNGKSFTQDLNADELIPLHFKWNHYVSPVNRVDPSKSNIIDTIILTESYYTDVLTWKNSRSTSIIPPPPTTENLRQEFAELNTYKSISDEMVYNSGKFKVLFGNSAALELQASFKVVKIPTSGISDNELKTRVIQAIDVYFDINNWDFGEKFYYTELAAYIHTQLSKFLSSVVIVPVKQSSEFGNLFEIVSEPNELFISTATVSNVEIVNNFTETNLRM